MAPEATEVVEPVKSHVAITPDVKIPPRSRTFTEEDAKQVLALLNGKPAVPAHKDEDGKDVPEVEAVGPAQNVGFGEFDSQGAARSAGVSLNKWLESLGAPHKYAITTLPRDGKFVGVVLNKPAKGTAETPEEAPAPEPAPEPAPAAPAPSPDSVRRQSNRGGGRRSR